MISDRFLSAPAKGSTVVSVLILAGIAAAGCKSLLKPTPSPPAWLAADVSLSRLEQSEAAYMGSGDALEAKLSPFTSGMSIMIMRRNADGTFSGYRAGDLSSKTGKLLRVECKFKNTSTRPQTFHPFEIQLSGKESSLAAFGYRDDYPFAKASADWERLDKSEIWSLQPAGETRSLVYIFSVVGGTSAWNLMYNSAKIAELNPQNK